MRSRAIRTPSCRTASERTHRLVAGALVAIALVASYLTGLATPPDSDERLYVAMARNIDAPAYEIPRRPTAHGSPFIGNPPLVVFVAATARAVVGDGIEALRVVHLLVFLPLFLFVTHELTRRLFGRRAALIALFLAVLVEPLASQAGQVRLDVPLAGLGGLSLLLGHAAIHGRRRRTAATIGSALALAVAVLAKYEAIYVPLALALDGLWRSWRARRICRRTVAVLATQAVVSSLLMIGWFAWIHASDAGLERFGRIGARHLGPTSMSALLVTFVTPLRRFVLLFGLPVVGLALVGAAYRRTRRASSRRSISFPAAWIVASLVLQVLVDRGAERHLFKALPAVLALAGGSLPLLAAPLGDRGAERRFVIALPIIAALTVTATLLVWWPKVVVVGAIIATTLGLIALARLDRVAAARVRRGAIGSIAVVLGIALIQHLAAPNVTARFGPEMRLRAAHVIDVASDCRRRIGPKAIVAYPRAEYGFYDRGPYVHATVGADRLAVLVDLAELILVESDEDAKILADRGWTAVVRWEGQLRAFAR